MVAAIARAVSSLPPVASAGWLSWVWAAALNLRRQSNLPDTEVRERRPGTCWVFCVQNSIFCVNNSVLWVKKSIFCMMFVIFYVSMSDLSYFILIVWYFMLNDRILCPHMCSLVTQWEHHHQCGRHNCYPNRNPNSNFYCHPDRLGLGLGLNLDDLIMFVCYLISVPLLLLICCFFLLLIFLLFF